MKWYDLNDNGMLYSEEELHDINCQSCGNSYHYAINNYKDTDNRHYFFEGKCGRHYCQNEECVYTYILEEHTQLQLTER